MLPLSLSPSPHKAFLPLEIVASPVGVSHHHPALGTNYKGDQHHAKCKTITHTATPSGGCLSCEQSTKEIHIICLSKLPIETAFALNYKSHNKPEIYALIKLQLLFSQQKFDYMFYLLAIFLHFQYYLRLSFLSIFI